MKTKPATIRAKIRHQKKPDGLARKNLIRKNGSEAARSIRLNQAFINFSSRFGVIPERLAERVLESFAARNPCSLELKALPARGARARQR